MAISFTKYVDIVSGVAGGAGVARKDLILRLYTTNELLPPDTVAEMTTLADVGAYFGTTSGEYKRASFYFGFVSKSIKSPKKIAFYRYVDQDLEPLIFGGTAQKAYTSFTAITDGSFDLEIGGVTNTITTDFTTATDLASVASLIQAQIQLETEAQFATATVTYNATRGSFDFVGGVAEDATISVSVSATGTDITGLLGWDATAIFSSGKLEETITTCLDASVDISTNFATFAFIPTLTLAEKEEVAQWTKAQNVRYLYLTSTSYNDAQDHYDTLNTYGGTDVILEQTDEYHELMPACIAAATDYTKINSVQNYMFYQFSATPTVTTTAVSNELDDLRVNYYGQTQTAGQNISFYQRSNLMGLPVDPLAENLFINEVWFKDACGSEIMSLLLNLQQVAWNGKGRGQILNTVQGVIEEALFNGVISPDKPLNNAQKLTIAQLTGDDEAWREVANKGYWVDCFLESSVTQSGITEYRADYIIIYSKSDSIRKVNGSDVLI